MTAALAALDTALPAGWKVSGIRFKHDLGGVVLMNGGFVGYPHGEHIRTVVTGNLSEMMADVAEWGDRGDD